MKNDQVQTKAILDKLERLRAEWMNRARQLNLIPESETRNSKMTKPEISMFNYLNCANEIQIILREGL